MFPAQALAHEDERAAEQCERGEDDHQPIPDSAAGAATLGGLEGNVVSVAHPGRSVRPDIHGPTCQPWRTALWL